MSTETLDVAVWIKQRHNFICSIARKAHQRIGFADAYAICLMGVAEAVPEFDPAKGPFHAIAGLYMRRAISHANQAYRMKKRDANEIYFQGLGIWRIDSLDMISVEYGDDDDGEYERAKDLDRAMSLLAERDRRVLELRFGLDGKGERNLEEIAEILGVTRPRVWYLEKRAMGRVRQAMGVENTAAA